MKRETVHFANGVMPWQTLPPGGIKAFLGFLHMHLLGSSISVQLIRNGRELPAIMKGQYCVLHFLYLLSGQKMYHLPTALFSLLSCSIFFYLHNFLSLKNYNTISSSSLPNPTQPTRHELRLQLPTSESAEGGGGNLAWGFLHCQLRVRLHQEEDPDLCEFISSFPKLELGCFSLEICCHLWPFSPLAVFWAFWTSLLCHILAFVRSFIMLLYVVT